MSEQTSDNKATYQVPATWQEKFALLEQIGADRQFLFKAMATAEFKGLSFKQRQKITFNLPGFFFGPFYYFAKKMWHKGALLLVLTWLWCSLLFLAEVALNITLVSAAYWILPAVICAQLASYDYFRLITRGEKTWPGLPAILTAPAGVTASPVLAFLWLFTLTFNLMPAQTPQCYSKDVTDIVLQLSEEEITKRLSVASSPAIELTLTAINTTDSNEQAYQCAAQLQMTGSDVSRSIPVSYSVEFIDDGQAFNVSVFL
ncbi:DUF2628 domain-containing protein [Thalassomonas viridans]|uniref:DUF2628 domain-containing protein n=1 Tax=Thalassomonas viridans TaxID=137584 RepID=A0AAE9YZW5_9GAMM|nr:DUF2628 domain-containing protein [Thalassomonas viridans]WDE03652.1 DUF2628 domain-containing protein [Thalassomonas viridans]